MSYDTRDGGMIGELPCGLAGMRNRENRLQAEPVELLLAESVSYQDGHLQREPGTQEYDPDGVGTSVAYVATTTLTGVTHQTSIWTNDVFMVQGTGTPAFVRTIDFGGAQFSFENLAAVNLTVSGADVPIGAFVVVMAAVQLSTAAIDFAIADDGGNTWTQHLIESPTLMPEGDADTRLTRRVFGTPAVMIWTSKITTALTAGDNILVACSGMTSDSRQKILAVVADEYNSDAESVIESTWRTRVGTESELDGFPSSIDTGETPIITSLPVLIIGASTFNETFTGGGSTPTPVLAVNATSGYTQRGSATFSPSGSSTVFSVGMGSRLETAAANIVAQYDWYSDALPVVAGTVTTVQGSTTVTGSGTTFTDHAPGDRIIVAGEVRIIETITSDTVLDTTEPWIAAGAGQTYVIRVGNRLITATSAGNLFKEKPTTLTTGDLDDVTLASALSVSGRPSYFVSGGKEAAAEPRKLFYFNGVDPVQVLSGDGVTTTDIADPPADWDTVANPNEQPIAGVIHSARLVAFGNLNDPDRLYFSSPDDHEDFTTDPFSLAVRNGIGDRLYAAASFQGVLFAFKYPRGIFWLDDSDIDPLNWVIRTKTEALGIAQTPYAVLPMDDDMIIMAPDASFHVLSAIDAMGGVKTSSLSYALGLNKWIRENVNRERLEQTVSIWNQTDRQAIFSLPGTDSPSNSVRLIFDFGLVSDGGPVRFAFSRREAATSLCVRRSVVGGPEIPVIGSGPTSYIVDTGVFTAAGVSFTTTWQTPHFDFAWLRPAFRYLRKQFDRVELVFEPEGCGGSCTVETLVDGEVKQIDTLDVTTAREWKSTFIGDGHTLSIRVTKNDEFNLKVLSTIVYLRPSNEDQSR